PRRAAELGVLSRPGAGGLETLRLDVVYEAAGTGRDLRFREGALSGVIGWREVPLSARDGARVLDSTVPMTSESDELRAYPKELLRSPLDVSRAAATVVAGGSPGDAPRLDAAPAQERGSGGFEALIEQGDLSLSVLLLSLLIAAF